MNKVFYFHGAPAVRKVYGDRTKPTTCAIVVGAASKDAAREAALRAMGSGVTISGGNAFTSVAKAEEQAAFHKRLYGIVHLTVDMGMQRDLAKLVGM